MIIRRRFLRWAAVGGVARLLGAGRGDEGKELFDGVSLAGWKRTDFYGGGAVKVEKPFRGGGGAIVIEPGSNLSGITWTDAGILPKTNYEIALEAMKLAGRDFFCGLTFPVGDDACSFIAGGWGGKVVGLSSVDGFPAAENETSAAVDFDHDRWYRIRVQVTPGKIRAWIDNRQMVDLEIELHQIGLYLGSEIDQSLPLGIATYQTRAAIRNIRLRRQMVVTPPC